MAGAAGDLHEGIAEDHAPPAARTRPVSWRPGAGGSPGSRSAFGLLSIVATRFGGIPPANGLRLLALAILLAVLAAVAAGFAFAAIWRTGAPGTGLAARGLVLALLTLAGPAGWRWRPCVCRRSPMSRRIPRIRRPSPAPAPRSTPAAAMCRPASTGTASAIRRGLCRPPADPARRAARRGDAAGAARGRGARLERRRLRPRRRGASPRAHRRRGPLAALPFPGRCHDPRAARRRRDADRCALGLACAGEARFRRQRAAISAISRERSRRWPRSGNAGSRQREGPGEADAPRPGRDRARPDPRDGRAPTAPPRP